MDDAKKILKLLLDKYPSPKSELNFSNHLELLIATILSAQCTDKKVNQVTEKLFKKYKKISDYANADLQTLQEEIKPAGFYKNKAKQIINCCKEIIKRFNGKVPNSLEDLISLPGIGRKTANVILSAGFGKQAIPVDTHVLRVSNRVGLVCSKKPEEVEALLMKQIPMEYWSVFSLAMILHGRHTCKAKKPLCNKCILYNECKWQKKGG